MARINIDDELHADHRFKRLVRKLGDEDKAVGLLYRFWRIAQDKWGREFQLVDPAEFDADGFGPLLEVGLAERRPDGIYACGSEVRFAWYLQKVRAGKARARCSRNVDGTFAAAQHPAASQRGTSGTPAHAGPNSSGAPIPDQLPVPVPVTVPVSKTSVHRRAASKLTYPDEFEKLWTTYRPKLGSRGDKGAAFKAYRDLELSADESEVLAQAIPKYLADCTAKKRIEQNFSTFLRSDWREHLKLGLNGKATHKWDDDAKEVGHA